ncbi:MAG: hypothetical protein ACLU24_12390 [Candidatus Pseudoruminococcus sp.]
MTFINAKLFVPKGVRIGFPVISVAVGVDGRPAGSDKVAFKIERVRQGFSGAADLLSSCRKYRHRHQRQAHHDAEKQAKDSLFHSGFLLNVYLKLIDLITSVD